MLKDLKNSVIGRADRFASLWAGIIEGVSPALAAVACLAPFFLSTLGAFSINFAIQLSIAVALLVMFLLGAFLRKMSSKSMLLHGIKMLFVGLILTFIFIAVKLIQ